MDSSIGAACLDGIAGGVGDGREGSKTPDLMFVYCASHSVLKQAAVLQRKRPGDSRRDFHILQSVAGRQIVAGIEVSAPDYVPLVGGELQPSVAATLRVEAKRGCWYSSPPENLIPPASLWFYR